MANSPFSHASADATSTLSVLAQRLDRLEAENAALRATFRPPERPTPIPATSAPDGAPANPAGPTTSVEPTEAAAAGDPSAPPAAPVVASPSRASTPGSHGRLPGRSPRAGGAPVDSVLAPGFGDERSRQLAAQLLRHLSPQDFLDAVTAYGIPVAETDVQSLLRAVMASGYAAQILEEATLHPASPAEDGDAPGTLVERPPVSPRARGGHVEPPVEAVPSADLARLREEIASLTRRAALSDALTAPLGGPLRAQFLDPERRRPSDALMASLVKQARDSAAATFDLALSVPTFGDATRFLRVNAANDATGAELRWSIQQLNDQLAMFHQVLVALSTLSLSRQAMATLTPVTSKLADLWTMIHGHVAIQQQRMRALARGAVTRDYDPRPPLPDCASLNPTSVVTAADIAQWRQMAETATSAAATPAKRAAEFATGFTPAKLPRFRGRGGRGPGRGRGGWGQQQD